MRKALSAGCLLMAFWCLLALLAAPAGAREDAAPASPISTPVASDPGPVSAQTPAAEAPPSPAEAPAEAPAESASPAPAETPTAETPAPAAETPAPAESPAPAPAEPAPPIGPRPGGAPKIPGATPPTGADEGREVLIKAIEVEGNNAVPAADILQVVTSRIGEPADKDRIQRDLQNIYEMGYFTDVKVRTEPFLNGVRVVYQVLENPVVQSILIEGNKIVATDKLRSLMETHEGKILNTKTLFADITVINRYYDNELGYLLEPTHVTELKFSKEGVLKLGITEGVVVKDVSVVGNTVLPSRDIRPLIKMQPGQLFNQFTMKEDADRISKYYEKRDYILDNIRPSIDKNTGVVTYQIVEAVVEEIRIEGNTRTRSYVIRRLMRTKVGNVLKRHRLQRDLERLNSSGFFESVNIEPEPGSDSGKVVLVLKVKEQKTGLATLGLGYSGGGTGAVRSGITGAISFSERNLNGRGQSASISWQRGVNVSSAGVSWFDPAINDRQDSLGFSFFASEFNELRQPVLAVGNVVSYALYNDNRVGGSVTFGRFLSEDVRAFVTFRQEHLELTQSANSQFTATNLGVGNSNTITFSSLLDTRDDLFNPHKGSYGNAAFTGSVSGIFSYTKFQVEARHYIPMFRDHTIALRAWTGFVNGNAPITEIFFVGGADTLRAYQENSFIGNRFVVFNAEYRFPIAKLKLLNGAFFTDAGGAWYAGQPASIFKDVGVGLRIVFPSLGLGVIRLDYAIGERGSRSTIGLGQTF